MDIINYAIYNEALSDALCFKRTLLEFFREGGVLNFNFRAGTKAVLMKTLESCKSTNRLPHVLLTCFPLYNEDSKNLIREASANYPEVKILLLTKTRDKKMLLKPFHDGANGAMDYAGSIEALAANIIAASRQMMEHGNLNNEYLKFYLEQMRSDKNAFNTGQYEPDGTDIKIAECLWDGLQEKEIATALKLNENQVKNRISNFHDKTHSTNRKGIVMAKWFVLHGYISDSMHAA
jgi:DNA-binding NarL/FixJ family response regulator